MIYAFLLRSLQTASSSFQLSLFCLYRVSYCLSPGIQPLHEPLCSHSQIIKAAAALSRGLALAIVVTSTCTLTLPPPLRASLLCLSPILDRVMAAGSVTMPPCEAVAPLNFIYACSVCCYTLADVYDGQIETVRGLSDGINSKDRLVTHLYLGSCCHVFCGSHLEGGGESASLSLCSKLLTASSSPVSPRGTATESTLPDLLPREEGWRASRFVLHSRLPEERA
jgi:hypothetical protein